MQSVNILRQTVRVIIETGDEKEARDYAAADLRWKARGKKGRDKNRTPDPEELEEELLAEELLDPENDPGMSDDRITEGGDAAETAVKNRKSGDRKRRRDRRPADEKARADSGKDGEAGEELQEKTGADAGETEHGEKTHSRRRGSRKKKHFDKAQTPDAAPETAAETAGGSAPKHRRRPRMRGRKKDSGAGNGTE